MTFNLIIVAIVILLGLIFLLAEIFLLPGLTISGIAGFIFLVGGVAYSYLYIGTMAGNFTLVITAFLILGSFLYFVKSKSIRRISLETNIDSKVDTSDLKKINVGDEGITQSRLNPIGKVFINDITVEAKSINGEMINEDTPVIVNKVEWSNILVSVKENQSN